MTTSTPILEQQALPATAVSSVPLVMCFDDIGIEDIPLDGGKNASLGEMRRARTSKGVPVPD